MTVYALIFQEFLHALISQEFLFFNNAAFIKTSSFSSHFTICFVGINLKKTKYCLRFDNLMSVVSQVLILNLISCNQFKFEFQSICSKKNLNFPNGFLAARVI